MTNSQSDNTHDSDQPDTAEHHPHLEPLFWGTGDMLVWDAEQLLSTIDQNELFKTYWDKEYLSDEELNHVSKTVYTREFEELSTRIIQDQLIDARGFYGYFPVMPGMSASSPVRRRSRCPDSGLPVSRRRSD